MQEHLPMRKGRFQVMHCPVNDIVDHYSSDVVAQNILSFFPLGCLLSIMVYLISFHV